MLIFFHKLDKLRDQAITLYQEIEREYSTDIIDGQTCIIPTPMNIPMGIEGSSNKPYRANAFGLARLAFALTDENPNELQGAIERAFVKMEDYHSDPIGTSDETEEDVSPRILDTLNGKRFALMQLCQELALDMIRFRVAPERFTANQALADLLEYFAIRLVDEKRFGCTPALFDLAREKSKIPNSGLKENASLAFWLNLKESFEKMTSFNHHGLHSSNHLFVDVGSEEERATKLAAVLLGNLSKEESQALKSFISTQHADLQAKKATLTFNFMAEGQPRAITPALNTSMSVMPGSATELAVEKVGDKRKLRHG